MKTRFLQAGLLVAVSGLLTLFAVDLFVFHILDIKVPAYKRERFFEFSPLLGWQHRRNSEGFWYRYNDGSRYYVTINSHGFADSERDLKKSRPRIALIGDSTTEFWEADTNDRGQFLIERLLDHRFEVLNFGVRAYGTDQTYILFKHKGVHFYPDIVIYNFCINDIGDNSTSDSKPFFDLQPGEPGGVVLKGYPIINRRERHFLNRTLTDYSFVYRKAKDAAVRSRRMMGGVFGRTDVSASPTTSLEHHFELRPYKRAYDRHDHKRWEVTTRIISLIDAFTKERGIRLLVVEGLYKPVLDEKQQETLVRLYGDQFEFDKVTRLLADHAASSGIAFLSLPRRLKDRNIDVNGLMHSEDSMHLNKEGIRFYADEVVAKLRSLQWVDGETGGQNRRRTDAPPRG